MRKNIIQPALVLATIFSASTASAEENSTPKPSSKVHFDTVDLDANGLITPEEMTTWRSAKFVTRDLDDDGLITRDELMEEAKDGARAMTWEESTAFFMAFDENTDLLISGDEVKDAIERSNFFEILDFNGSGSITRHEASGWMDTSPRKKPEPAPVPTVVPDQDPKQDHSSSQIEKEKPMSWSLFIDDERFPPARDGRNWMIARNVDEVLELLTAHGAPEFISFDHDLGEDTESGFFITKTLVEKDMDGEIDIPEGFDFYVHSQNPVGRDNIRSYLDSYLKFKRQ